MGEFIERNTINKTLSFSSATFKNRNMPSNAHFQMILRSVMKYLELFFQVYFFYFFKKMEKCSKIVSTKFLSTLVMFRWWFLQTIQFVGTVCSIIWSLLKKFHDRGFRFAVCLARTGNASSMMRYATDFWIGICVWMASFSILAAIAWRKHVHGSMSNRFYCGLM